MEKGSVPADEAPDELVQDSHIFGLDFHPSDDLLAVALISGDVKIYRYGSGGSTLVHHAQPHSAACRTVMFSHDGRYLLSGSSDKSIRVTDVHTGQTVYTVPDAHGAAVNVLSRGGDGQQHQVFSGDDDGEVRVWDLRQPTQAVHAWHEHTDYIAALLPCPNNTLLSAGGDGRLGVWQTRKGRLEAMSDEQDDELLSVAVVKHGRKVVVGTQSGVLLYWTWGQWGDQSDRFPGHPMSVDQVVPIDDDTLVTASSDGLLRLCRLQPNRLLGVLGEHGAFPVELLRRSRDGRWLASASHDQVIKFWDLNYLLVSDGKEEEDEQDAEPEAMDADAGGDGGDDGSDDDDSDSDSDDDMMPVDRQASRGPKRRSRNFFGGLL